MSNHAALTRAIASAIALIGAACSESGTTGGGLSGSAGTYESGSAGTSGAPGGKGGSNS